MADFNENLSKIVVFATVFPNTMQNRPYIYQIDAALAENFCADGR